MNILHIDCSPRLVSHSRRLSAAVVKKLVTIIPAANIRRRDLGLDPIPHLNADYAAVLATPESLATADPAGDALRLSEQLIQELEEASVVVIGTPMNNFTIPSVLKAWIDQVLRVNRTIRSTPAGKIGMLPNCPVFVGIASGGIFTGDDANQEDFLTPYLSAALGCIGLKAVHFLPLQGTAFMSETRITEVERSLIDAIEPAMLSLVPDRTVTCEARRET